MKSAYREEKDENRIDFLRELADAGTRQGRKYEQNGQLDLAEEQFLLALKAQEQLLSALNEQCYADAAMESCSSLADICMQQGNMHGADFYYARAMGYRQGMRFC